MPPFVTTSCDIPDRTSISPKHTLSPAQLEDVVPLGRSAGGQVKVRKKSLGALVPASGLYSEGAANASQGRNDDGGHIARC